MCRKRLQALTGKNVSFSYSLTAYNLSACILWDAVVSKPCQASTEHAKAAAFKAENRRSVYHKCVTSFGVGVGIGVDSDTISGYGRSPPEKGDLLVSQMPSGPHGQEYFVFLPPAGPQPVQPASCGTLLDRLLHTGECTGRRLYSLSRIRASPRMNTGIRSIGASAWIVCPPSRTCPVQAQRHLEPSGR